MPRCNAPRILDAYLHRSLEVCKHAPSQSSQPSCLHFTATSLDGIGWSPPDWSSALFSACLSKSRTVNDHDIASDLISHWYSRLASAPFSLLEASPSIQIFVDSVCRQSASALELHVFSSAPHPLAFPLRASCDPSCFFCRSGRKGLLKMQIGFAFRVAYPLQLQRSGCSQPWQCLYDLIFTFTPEIDAGEQRFLRDPHSNTE
jgi:hypothetical protein